MLGKLFKKNKGDSSVAQNPIRTFWGWFLLNESKFVKRLQLDREQTPEVLDEILGQVQLYHPSVYGLMGFCDDGKLEFVFTADGVVKNIVFIEDLLAEAPKLDHWLFTCLKPQYGSYDFSINYYDFIFDKDRLKFFSKIDDRYPDEICITLTHPDYTKEEDYNVILNGSLIFLDNCLGELNTACRIDYFDLVAEGDVDGKDLIPIEKLESYLVWREKEYLQKYEEVSFEIPKENYALLEGSQEDTPVIAVVNQGWADWPYKPIFSWLIRVSIKFEGNAEGLPNKEQLETIQTLEDKVIDGIDPAKTCVVGRVTSANTSTIYLYANEYKDCSRTIFGILNTFDTEMEIDYFMSKDKYWAAVERFL